MAQRRFSPEINAEEQLAETVSPHPRTREALFGHATAEAVFLHAYRTGAIHHAWLLTGERGIGKATFAYFVAKFLLSRGGSPEPAQTLAISPDDPVARQIAAGAHPSLFVLSGSAKPGSIGVEAVRDLRGFLGLTTPRTWRAMIVDPVNDLTTASANALLKAIEEPPPGTVFFLIGQGAANVLPTIRSRCVRLAFRPLSKPDFKSAVLSAWSSDEPAPDDEALAKLHAASRGSPGRAIALARGGLLIQIERLDRIVQSLPRLDRAAVHDLIQAVLGIRNADSFAPLCDAIEQRVEGLAKNGAKGWLGAAAAWAEVWERLRERRRELEALNLDKGAFLMTAFSDMERVSSSLSNNQHSRSE